MTSVSDRQQLSFGPFRLDVRDERLWQGTQAIELRPKSLAVLRVLLESAGRLVSKEALFERVWPGLVVGDDTLTGCLGEIRQALGDDPRRPTYVETVHRRGYRFVAAVVEGDASVGVAAVEPGAPPVVGRAADLDRLNGLLSEAAGGRRRLVFVTGGAGIGKTTLVDAFLAGVAAMGAAWLGRGECIEHFGEGEPYLPVLAALGRLARGARGPRFVELLDRYAPSWLIQMPALLVPDALEALRRRTAAASPERMLRELAEALEAITAERTLVLVLEDLHWSDRATLDLLAYLGRRPEPARLLVVGTYRPVDVIVGGHPLRAVTRDLAQRRQCVEVGLELLTERYVAEYLAATPAHAGWPRADVDLLARAIHRRTDGHPLFLVAVVDALVRRTSATASAGELSAVVASIEREVPESLRQFIEHQFEQLGADEQRLLEVASVVGHVGSAAAIAAGLGEAVETVERRATELARRGPFLDAQGAEEWPDGTTAGRYAFRHAIYREAVYPRVAAAEAIRLHRRIGERIEAAYGARGVERAAELALHFERGRDDPRSTQYHGQAAATAMRRWAYHDAVGHLTVALEALGRAPDTVDRASKEVALLTTLGQALIATNGPASPEVARTFERARELCERLGDTPQQTEVLIGLRRFYTGQNDHGTALELARQLLALSERRGDAALRLEADLGIGISLFFSGDPRGAEEHFARGAADAAPDPSSIVRLGQDAVLLCLSYSALTAGLLGFADRAREWHRRAVARLRECPQPLSRVIALNLAASLTQLLRDVPATQAYAEETIALGREHGFPLWAAIGTILRGWALAQQGRGDDGIALVHEGIAVYRALTSSGMVIASTLAVLAETYLRTGRSDEDLLAIAPSFSRRNQIYYAEFFRLRGELALRAAGEAGPGRTRGGPREAEAEAWFREALESARDRGVKALELRAAMSLARLWQRRAKRREARAVLAETYGWFTEGFDTPDLREACALLAELRTRAE